MGIYIDSIYPRRLMIPSVKCLPSAVERSAFQLKLLVTAGTGRSALLVDIVVFNHSYKMEVIL